MSDRSKVSSTCPVGTPPSVKLPAESVCVDFPLLVTRTVTPERPISTPSACIPRVLEPRITVPDSVPVEGAVVPEPESRHAVTAERLITTRAETKKRGADGMRNRMDPPVGCLGGLQIPRKKRISKPSTLESDSRLPAPG